MRILAYLLLIAAVSACKHPLQIRGQGSIIERIYGERGCSWAEFQAGSTRCTDNDVEGERYLVSYEAVPEPGWTFSHWEGLQCAGDSVGDYCEYDIPKFGIDKAHADHPEGLEVPATIAVFVRDETPDPEGLDLEVFRAVSPLELSGDPRSGPVPSIRHPLAQLGMKLFFSKSLSGDFSVACASCHHPALAGGDGLSLPVGFGARKPNLLGPGRERRGGKPLVPRNSPTTFNSSLYRDALFHDGRVSRISAGISTPDAAAPWEADPLAGDDLLAAQARFPVTVDEEMRSREFLIGADNEALRTRLAERIGDYGAGAGEIEDNRWLAEFEAAFGSGIPREELVTYDNIALAISTYQQSQSFVESPWKAFLEGDYDAISDKAKRGALAFFEARPLLDADAEVSCADCHTGDHFTNEEFQAIGFPQIGPGRGAKGAASRDDRGRGNLFDSETLDYRFRVPSLLNVANTGPWGHAGSYGTLREVVAHYGDAEGTVANYFGNGGWCQLDQFKDLDNCASLYPRAEGNTAKALRKVREENAGSRGLPLVEISDQEVEQMVAFLRTLTDPCIEDRECLKLWIPEKKDAPDGHQLNAVTRKGKRL